jgi:hypothetical protein
MVRKEGVMVGEEIRLEKGKNVLVLLCCEFFFLLNFGGSLFGSYSAWLFDCCTTTQDWTSLFFFLLEFLCGVLISCWRLFFSTKKSVHFFAAPEKQKDTTFRENS